MITKNQVTKEDPNIENNSNSFHSHLTNTFNIENLDNTNNLIINLNKTFRGNNLTIIINNLIDMAQEQFNLNTVI